MFSSDDGAVVEGEDEGESFSLRVGRDRDGGIDRFTPFIFAVKVVCVVFVGVTVDERRMLLRLVRGVERDRSLNRKVFDGVAVTSSSPFFPPSCCCVSSPSPSPFPTSAPAISFNFRFLEGEAGSPSAVAAPFPFRL